MARLLAGAVVLVRRSAAETAQMLRAFVPSVVVTEIVEDDETGPAVLREIRRLSSEDGGAVPVIGICAPIPDAAAAIRAEFQGLLAAPFESAEVARLVLRALESVG
jgi:DNA-binding NtrC family response regulator